MGQHKKNITYSFKNRRIESRFLGAIKRGLTIVQDTIGLPSNIDSFNSTKAIIYKSELDYLLKCILEYPNIETGGQLFGFWTPKGSPVVLYAIGPGPNAGHHSAFFSQDIDYLDFVGNEIVKTFGLTHIGEWHSHHQLGLAQPSGHDASNMQGNIDRLNLGHFMLCIGNCTNTEADIKPFMFYQNAQEYIRTQWDVVELDSPFRAVIDGALQNVLIHPRNHVSTSTSYNVKPHLPERTSPIYNEGYWLNDKENGMVLKEICDFVKTKNRGYNVNVKLDERTKLVHLVVSDRGRIVQDIVFEGPFPYEPPLIFYYDIYWGGKKPTKYQKLSKWSYQGNILDSFKNYYSNN